MIEYNSIFIDLDGPVLDGKHRHYKCYVDIVQKYKGVPLNIEEYWERKRNKENVKNIIKDSLLNIEREQFITDWLDNIEDLQYIKLDKLKPLISDTIKNMRKKSSNVYLITKRNNIDNLYLQLETYKLIDLFDEILVADKVSKYELAITKEVNRSLVIGDTEVDVELASMINARFIGILNGLRNKSFFEGYECYDELFEIRL